MHSTAIAKEHFGSAGKVDSNPSEAAGAATAATGSSAAFSSLLGYILAHCLQRSQSSGPGFGCWSSLW